jgi:tRNA pseudouridine55 synthase
MVREAGVVVLDKPAGMSSARALDALKKKLGIKKAGHAGTLDPMATGVLVCLIGKATRLAAYAEAGRKTYSGTMRFGLTTSTDDIEGEVITSGGGAPALEALRDAARECTGVISQVPPNVSAVKIDGERAYKKARRGEEMKLSAREVEVFDFQVLDLDGAEASFSIICSPGTYIRSLARDLGAKLGCGACVSSLRRERSEPFSVGSACTLEEADESRVLPWTALFPGVERIELPEDAARRLLKGDERVLRELNGTGGHGAAVYGTREGACGLLVRERDAWRVAVNVAQAEG